jgi:hypothetical protein
MVQIALTGHTLAMAAHLLMMEAQPRVTSSRRGLLGAELDGIEAHLAADSLEMRTMLISRHIHRPPVTGAVEKAVSRQFAHGGIPSRASRFPTSLPPSTCAQRFKEPVRLPAFRLD